MRKEVGAKTYFWAYDIFGYLLPGAVLVTAYGFSNHFLHQIFHPLWATGSVAALVMLGLLSYVLGHIISALSSWVLEKLILSRGIGYPAFHMFSQAAGSHLWRDIFLPSYFRPYSAQFQQRVRVLFEKQFGIAPDDHHDLFWLTWSYVSQHHHVAYRRATHFLDLYGFRATFA